MRQNEIINVTIDRDRERAQRDEGKVCVVMEEFVISSCPNQIPDSRHS